VTPPAGLDQQQHLVASRGKQHRFQASEFFSNSLCEKPVGSLVEKALDPCKQNVFARFAQ